MIDQTRFQALQLNCLFAGELNIDKFFLLFVIVLKNVYKEVSLLRT